MVHFEKKLEEHKIPLWDPYYLNYGALKRTIKKLKLRTLEHQQPGLFSMSNALTPQEARDYFSVRLDDEVEKVVLFFLKQQGLLAAELLSLNMESEQARDMAPMKRKSSVALSALEAGEVYDKKSFGNLMALMDAGGEGGGSPRALPREEAVAAGARRRLPTLPEPTWRSRSATGSDGSEAPPELHLQIVGAEQEDGSFDGAPGQLRADSYREFDVLSPTGAARASAAAALAPLGQSMRDLGSVGLGADRLAWLRERYVHTARSLLALIGFLDLNVTGLRKIIKKFEKTLGQGLGRAYLTSRQEQSMGQLRVLYRNEGLRALITAVRRALDELAHAKDAADGGGGGGPGTVRRSLRRRRRDSEDVEPVYQKLVVRQRMMEHEQRRMFQQFLIQRTDMFLELAGHEEDEEMEEELARDGEIEEHMPSYYINLACTFLYMANFTINSPTCPRYSVMLGGDATLNGMINGMTPFAACVSCVWFSVWTNTRFKPPLYLSILMLCIGNTMYATALYFDAFWMLCLGRLMLGLGGPRGMNRRYIADTVPVSRRTAASAAFVGATAAGVAIGPAFAGVWGENYFEVWGHRITPETAPGWAMVLLWVIFLFLLIFVYREPTFRYTPSGKSKEPAATASAGDPTDGSGQFSKSSFHQSATADLKYTVIKGGQGYEAGTSINEKTRLAPKSLVNQDPCCPRVPLPVWALLYFYFVQKYVTELIVQSMPIISNEAFGWSIEEVGGALTGLAVIVLPVNMVTGKLSQNAEDRVLLAALSVAAAALLLFILDFQNYGIEFTVGQYLLGCFSVYAILCAYEGVLMSLLSRLVTPEMARGTFNSGLLATEFGTFGRTVADFSISFVGSVGTVDQFVNGAFLPCVALVISIFVGTVAMYSRLKA